VGCLG